MVELKEGMLVVITQGRYAGRVGTYRHALPCGYFHVIDLGEGLVTLVAREGLAQPENERPRSETRENAPAG